jgi:hypothetical protein
LGWIDISVLVAALIVFLLFLFLLIRFAFPQGSRLGELASDRSSGAESIAAGGELGLLSGRTDAIGRFIARLGDVQRDVKIRPADSVVWTSAARGTSVRNRDAVQTFANSRARVDFTTDNELRIGQNSLIVFRSGTADPFLQRRDPAVVVLGGEMQGSVNSDYGTFAVQFPAGVAELTSIDSGDDEVTFRVGVNPDQSSTIVIYSGRADVNIAGQNYLVPANHGLTVSADGQSAEISVLPAIPVIRTPADSAVAKYLETPPRVNFRWGAVTNAKSYRLEIAKDREFEELLVDETRESTSFTHANLSPGEYYWRVSARAGWSLGPTSVMRRLRVVRDAEPPFLELAGIDRSADGRYVLRGRTTSDAKVYVHGTRVNKSTGGHFEYLFNPEPGTQTIVVEAIDAVGNVAYGSQVLHVPSNPGGSD